MALQKQPVSINFAKGVETKTDPNQIPLDSFAAMNNSVFTTTGRLTKRNGFKNITTLPNAEQTNITTLNDNLVATGTDLFAFNADSNQWINKGLVQPVQLSVNTITRTSTSQSSPDSAVASNGLVCATYTDSNGESYYQISDAATGQQVLTRVQLETASLSARVFVLGRNFIVTYLTVNGSPSLRYIAIPLANPQTPFAPATFSSSVSAITDGYDGVVANNNLYLSWSSSAISLSTAFLTQALLISPTVIETTTGATSLVSITPDSATGRVYVTYYSSGVLSSISYNSSLVPIMTTTTDVTAANLRTITSIFVTGLLNVFYETQNTVTELNSTNQNFVSSLTVTPPATTGAGTPSAPVIVLRSVGLASKAFISNSVIYILVVYGDPVTSNQPTYFLIDSIGNIYMKLAYSNGGGYEPTQLLPSVSNVSGTFSVPYLFKDFLTTVNKGTATGLPASAIYTQTGVNLATFTINDSQQFSSEIAGSLHLTGGQLWQYDGSYPVEHGFDVWPENQESTTSMTGGLLTAQTYNYQFLYEWTDAAGNIQRSAPSIPLTQVTTGTTSANTINVATLRITAKQPNPIEVAASDPVTNPVRIVGYRWSTAQQVYYQFTSVTAPVINDPTVDFVTIIDTLSDSAILGNAIIYTNGGVIENIGAPASIASALFNNRLWLVDAEDRNLLWFSKQVIENVPVEMSDLLTFFVAPTSGAQGSTGEITALYPMDDKLIIFKKDAIYYINGIGPDNTGANSQYSDPVFVTSSIGCSNPNSIVLMPSGLMFQSDKGIWLLGRGLDTTYIGSPVESYNSMTVLSAQSIPTTNQVRFILTSNITLMYDYFVQQWGTHNNIAAVSGTLYNSFQTYLNIKGQVFQETPGQFTDGSTPVLMSFTTAWINLAGLQGYERFYFGYLLGTYFTPFTLNVGIAYDYNSSAIQAIKISPDNYTPAWGGNALWGSGQPWGGPGNVFEARFFPMKQKCESFQLTITEVFDASIGAAPGQGLTLSGLNIIAGVKRGWRTQRATKSFG